jgi:hypothetical protein
VASSAYGSAASNRHPNGAASGSNSRPMPPTPITPSVRVVSPSPMWPVRSCQRPARVRRSLANSRPASASSIVSAATATGRRIATGVLVSTMPRSVSAGTSTES